MSSVLDVADPPPPDDGPWCTVIGGPTACRQPLPPPPASTAGNSAAGWLLGLVGCKEYPVLADLGRLYAQQWPAVLLRLASTGLQHCQAMVVVRTVNMTTV